MRKINDHSLYLVISEEYGQGRSAMEIASLAIAGGVDIIQMREKRKEKDGLVKLGSELAELCGNRGVIFIVNDDPALAREVGADGVHLGQEDIKRWPVDEARRSVGNDKLIGVSTHSLGQFKKANKEDVDYIAFGPIFPTKTKDYFLGTGDAPKVMKIARKPVFLIGGINLSNIDELLVLGASNIALIRGIAEAGDIVSKTRQFKNRITGFEKGG